MHIQKKMTVGPELVQALSKLRTIEGYWQPTDALYNLIFSRRANVSDMAAEFKKVSASSESDVSATILVLAFLSKYSQKEKPIWQGMWQKAVKLLEVSSHTFILLQILITYGPHKDETQSWLVYSWAGSDFD